MATLRDHFQVDFKDGSTDFDMTLTRKDDPTQSVVVRVRVFYNADTNVRYLGFYIPPESYTQEILPELLGHIDAAFETADSTVQINVGHAEWDPVGTRVSEMPFSRRVFYYVDSYLADEEKEALRTTAQAWLAVKVQVKDRTYVDSVARNQKPLAFISHDSRDKDEIVRPLALKLQSLICPVWYDEFSLKPGDSLRESIDKGLAEAPRCIVVLSKNFLSNPGWGKGEFNAAMNKHFSSGGRVLIPIWHGVTREEVSNYSTLVTDILAIDSSIGVDEMARRLLGVLKDA